MASLLHPRTIVLHKPRKTFGSLLVAKNSNTPYSDATKVSCSTATRGGPAVHGAWCGATNLTQGHPDGQSVRGARASEPQGAKLALVSRTQVAGPFLDINSNLFTTDRSGSEGGKHTPQFIFEHGTSKTNK